MSIYKFFIVIFLAVTKISVSAAEEQKPLGTVIVKLAGHDDSAGTLRVSLFDSMEGYTAYSSIKQIFVPASTSEVSFENLPYGTYAIRVYLDRNDNQKLDFHFWGAPKEPYGYSNNAFGNFREPGYSKVQFGVYAPIVHQNLVLK